MAQLPHNLHDIIKDADSQIDTSSPQKVFKQLQNGVLLNQNTQDARRRPDSLSGNRHSLPSNKHEDDRRKGVCRTNLYIYMLYFLILLLKSKFVKTENRKFAVASKQIASHQAAYQSQLSHCPFEI
ncbi:hypothetical protein Patl1_11872 [Pistacia atlantica]|uniref:Uncharacterized protein n=1 Tax=Pistacia atlantica TaxID=434234 RepID=A0ACC1A760_9ROSI|nr:hypothetical protein Patl1_11872 [Pistacia atlantica]